MYVERKEAKEEVSRAYSSAYAVLCIVFFAGLRYAQGSGQILHSADKATKTGYSNRL
jgi:hypothetical protein